VAHERSLYTDVRALTSRYIHTYIIGYGIDIGAIEDENLEPSCHNVLFLDLRAARIQLELQAVLPAHLACGVYHRVVAEQTLARVEAKAHAVAEVVREHEVSGGAVY
jgi:hypothetical protein